MRSFWKGEEGFAFSTEMIVVLTIVICGTIAAWTSLREAVVTEMADIGGAIGSLDQSYSFNGVSSHSSSCAGSSFNDRGDFCDGNGQPSDQGNERCVRLGGN
ncbi:MAG: hypothetical protein MPJ50_14445 [Pirellulales bacterium]|nr:hypothetical protein [Pirellulales bacterium]